MTDFETIRYDVHDGLATISLNRPDKLNAINHHMFDDLGAATASAAEDTTVRAVLLRAEGRSFCTGLDVAVMGQLSGTKGARFRSFVHTAQRPIQTLARMDKPVVVAVRGHALGAGFQLALSGDLRVAAADAKFGMLEARFGLVPDLGGNKPLVALVGTARAKELIWTGRQVEAEEAERIGLANRVVPVEELDSESERFAREIAHMPPLPIQMSKHILNRAHESPLELCMEREAQAQAVCVESEDHREAIAAFLEKRPARFHGR